MPWDSPCIVSGKFDVFSFKSSVKVWKERPNVCYKLIGCGTIIYRETCNKLEKIFQVIPKDTYDFATDILEELPFFTSDSASAPLINKSDKFSVLLRKLVPKRLETYNVYYELILDFQHAFLSIPLCSDKYIPCNASSPYFIACKNVSNEDFNTSMQIQLYLFMQATEKSCDHLNRVLPPCIANSKWLKETLLPTLLKWCLEKKHIHKGLQIPPSLSCINQEQYTITYSKLKIKYGKEIAKVSRYNTVFFNTATPLD